MWNGIRCASDTLINSFKGYVRRCPKAAALFESLQTEIPNKKGMPFDAFLESYQKACAAIGGSIIFPKHSQSVNQERGCDERICDRVDLTVECVRRFYKGETSGAERLDAALQKDAAFFVLFGGFKGYVDYFYLNDIVTEDYGAVRDLSGKNDVLTTYPFPEDPFPAASDDWLTWSENTVRFVKERNARIKKAVG